MSPKYKLTYFNMTNLAEPIRYLFSYAAIPFEDIRLEKEAFTAVKQNYPYGKLPVLEVDGKVITQSTAIARYVAKLAGLAGKNDWESAQADEIVDVILQDFRVEHYPLVRAKDDSEKAAVLLKLKSEVHPFYLGKLEKIVEQNGGTFVKGQITWADVYFACVAELLVGKLNIPDVFDKYPNLKALQEKIENVPGIKAYRATRTANSN